MPVTFISFDQTRMAEYCLAGDPWSRNFISRLPVAEITDELTGELETHRFTPRM
jgi:hypothetical protein